MSNITKHITPRIDTREQPDDAQLDFGELSQHIEDHWITKTSKSMDDFFAGKIPQDVFLEMLRTYWALPSMEAFFVHNPYKFYHTVLKPYMDSPAVDKAHEDDIKILKLFQQRVHAAKGETRPVGPLRRTVSDEQVSEGKPVITRGWRKNAKCVVKLHPSVYHRDRTINFAETSGPNLRVRIDYDPQYKQELEDSVSPQRGNQLGGIFTINGEYLQWFSSEPWYKEYILQPFDTAGLDFREWHVQAKVVGGGPSGRSEAIRLALVKAICAYYPDMVAKFWTTTHIGTNKSRKLSKTPGRIKHAKSTRYVRR